MGMQYDVKSAFATADAALVAYRVRIKGVFYAVTTVGTDVILYDNASAASGTAALTLPCDVVGQYNVYIPGEGDFMRERCLPRHQRRFWCDGVLWLSHLYGSVRRVKTLKAV
jgi:hypothetical protein